MNFDDLQKAWQSQTGRKLSLDADLLLEMVHRNKKSFESMVFWRDVREAGTAFVLTAYFTCSAITDHLWPLYVTAAGCLWVGLFILRDHWIQRRINPIAKDSLKECVETSLKQVIHQTWLLKNVAWWYLMPIELGLSVFIGYLLWQVRHVGWALAAVLAYSLVCYLIFRFTYWLNQKAVEVDLKPRRQELETLLASMETGESPK